MHFQKNHKGMSHAMWIVVALVVVLIVAVLLILIFGTSSGKAGKQGTDAIDNSGKGVSAEICHARCDTCKRFGSVACRWADFAPDCVTILPDCNT